MADDEPGPSWMASILVITLGIGVTIGGFYIVYQGDPKGFNKTVAETQKMLGMKVEPAEDVAEGEPAP